MKSYHCGWCYETHFPRFVMHDEPVTINGVFAPVYDRPIDCAALIVQCANPKCNKLNPYLRPSDFSVVLPTFRAAKARREAERRFAPPGDRGNSLRYSVVSS